MYEHIVFFDRGCPLCHRCVRHIIEIDKAQRFAFAPLNGETADDILSGPQEGLKTANTIVLVENYQSTERKFWVRSKAILRIYWLVGGEWKLAGSLWFFPSLIGDMLYKWVASHRHQFKMKMSEELGPKDRFLS